MAGPWGWIAIAAILAQVYGGALSEHAHRSFSAYTMNNDARQQIFPFYRYGDPELFRADYLGDYYLTAFFPIGYRCLFTAAAYPWDARLFSKTLPYLLLLVAVAAIGITADRIGGRAGAFGAMALCLGSYVFLKMMAGGLPRGFAVPVLATGMAALACGRVRIAMAIVWLGAAFYPVVGMVLGITLGLVLFVLPSADRGEAMAWSLNRRALVLGATAVVSALIMMPSVAGGRAYGRLITQSDYARYPEAGRGGRYQASNVPPWPGYLDTASRIARDALVSHGTPWSAPLRGWLIDGSRRGVPGPHEAWLWRGLAAIVLLGWIPLLWRSSAARIVTAFGASSVLGYWVACEASPYLYLPPRYVMYPVRLLYVLVVPLSMVSLTRYLGRDRCRSLSGALLRAGLCVLLLFAIGTRGDPGAGLDRSAARYARLLDRIAELPKDSLIAGWPLGIMDAVPYVTRRQALVTYENHQAFHEKYVKEMRRRMRALIGAYFATSVGPVLRLRNEFGVTHMLVDATYLRGVPPRYFKPFNAWTMDALRRGGSRTYLATEAVDAAVIFRDGSQMLVDLARLDEPRDQGGS